MRFLRLILAALIALTVMVGGLLAVALVVLTGLVGYAVQRFRRVLGVSRPVPPPVSNRQPNLRTDDVIDV